jgi:hypothetical protein
MGWTNWAKYGILPLLLGILCGLAFYTWAEGNLWEKKSIHPVYPATPTNVAVTTSGQIPYWGGFYNRALWDRYPLYYCLEGVGWSQEDHWAALDGIETTWGWAKIDNTVAIQIQERCREVGSPTELARVSVIFKMDSAFVQNYCQPHAGFTVVACVSFDDWKYISENNTWSYSTATVHVEPYYWSMLDHGWREHIIIHEFGHAGLGLWDTPAQACGVTVMDYTYEPSCGMLPYPRDADIDVTNKLYYDPTHPYGYKDPAWYKWLKDHQ